MIKQFSDVKSLNIVSCLNTCFAIHKFNFNLPVRSCDGLTLCLQGLPVYSFSFWMTDIKIHQFGLIGQYLLFPS